MASLRRPSISKECFLVEVLVRHNGCRTVDAVCQTQMSRPRFEVAVDVDLAAVLDLQSPPLLDHRSTSPFALSLFESRNVIVSDKGFVLDLLLFGGGPCCTLDWRPHKTNDVEYLALSCHPKNAKHNRIGDVLNGVGVVQIWTVQSMPQETSAARHVFALVHDGVICSALQWCPDPSELVHSASMTEQSLGLLAMALGNGDVCITLVPALVDATCVRVKPWVEITRERLQGSLVSCLDWQPCRPHAIVLLGCWDGTISIWALPFGDRSEAQHLLLHRIDPLAIRRVAWMRPPHGQLPDSFYRDHFCTVGHRGHLTIWDMRSMGMESLHDWTLTRAWIMDMDVSGNPFSIYAALEDASLRQLSLEMDCFTHLVDQTMFHVYSGKNKGAIHTIRCSPCNGLVAYAGEDGEIAVFANKNVGDARYRKPHICIGAMKYDPKLRVLKIVTAKEYRSVGGLYAGGTIFARRRTEVVEPEDDLYLRFERQTIGCVRFSPNGDNTTWLAAGNVSGLVRLIRVAE